MAERKTIFECECGLLHNTKAQAAYCAGEGGHFKELLEQQPVDERDQYGKFIRSTVWEKLETEIGTVLMRRVIRGK